MGRIDRYVTAIFLRVFLIAFISLTGMYIVGDFVGHLTEFLEYGEQHGGLASVLLEFYGARVPWLFDLMGRVVCLIAAAFAITWLQRQNELTALMAAGISRWRVMRAILIGCVVMSVLAAANRELVIPRLRQMLCHDARDLRGNNPKPVQPLRDRRTQILFGGRSTIANTRQIDQPNFRLPSELAAFGTRLLAERAHFRRPTAKHPAGYLLAGVREPSNIADIRSKFTDGRPVILTPLDTPWLKSDQCFVATDIPFEQLQAGFDWKQYASTWELLQGLRDSSLSYSVDARLTVHSRLVQPLLDILLVAVGLPAVLARGTRNVFVSIGYCLLMVTLFFAVVTTSQALGLNLLLSPTLAAWLPILAFVPTAAAMSEPFRH